MQGIEKSRIGKAIQILTIGLFLSLSFCVYMINGGLFWRIVPIWMFLGGIILFIVTRHIENKLWRWLILTALAVLAGIVLSAL